MQFLFVIIALAVPRVLMFIAFLTTNWFQRSFETRLWPLLGFLFMPYATLAYVATMLNNHALSGGWLALFILAVIVDVSHWGGSGYTYRLRSSRRGA